MNQPLRVAFVQDPDSLGWIEMDVSWPTSCADASAAENAQRTSRASISYAYCPFGPLVRWMDAVARGTDPAFVSWEDEGSDVHLGYETGELWFENCDHEGRWIATLPADEVAATFYTAFRDFVVRGYDRTRYETLTRLREVFLGRLGAAKTLTQLLRSITALPRQAAERAIDEITVSVATRPMRTDPWLPRGWDSASRSKRLRILHQLMNSRDYLGGSEYCLARLRSRAIERHIRPRRRVKRARRHAIAPHGEPGTG